MPIHTLESHRRAESLEPHSRFETGASAVADVRQAAPQHEATTLDLEEAARFLKIHPKTLQRLAHARRIPACKIGRSWLFVERLLVEHVVSESLLRVSVVDLQEKSECRSTDAMTRRTGGSSYRPSAGNRSLYNKALGLPTSARRSRSETGSPPNDGSRTGLA
jgi:excisionase family DNA binding protein